jgi:hypothetical protein
MKLRRRHDVSVIRMYFMHWAVRTEPTSKATDVAHKTTFFDGVIPLPVCVFGMQRSREWIRYFR